MKWSPGVLHSDRYGWSHSLNRVSLRWSDVLMLLIIRLHIPTGRFIQKSRVWLRATSLSPHWPQLKHFILEKSRPGWNGGQYPWQGVKGTLGDPDGWRVLSNRRAIGRISKPIFRARANIYYNVGGTVESGLLWSVYGCRSAIANMSSDSLSSSTANTCSAGLWKFGEVPRLAKSVQTSITVTYIPGPTFTTIYLHLA